MCLLCDCYVIACGQCDRLFTLLSWDTRAFYLCSLLFFVMSFISIGAEEELRERVDGGEFSFFGRQVGKASRTDQTAHLSPFLMGMLHPSLSDTPMKSPNFPDPGFCCKVAQIRQPTFPFPTVTRIASFRRLVRFWSVLAYVAMPDHFCGGQVGLYAFERALFRLHHWRPEHPIHPYGCHRVHAQWPCRRRGPQRSVRLSFVAQRGKQ